MVIGFPVSMFSSIYIYTYGGYLAIWGTSLAITIIGILYIMFLITDSRGKNKTIGRSDGTNVTDTTDDTDQGIIQEILSTFTTTFQPRTGYKRAPISLLLAAMCIVVCFQGKS